MLAVSPPPPSLFSVATARRLLIAAAGIGTIALAFGVGRPEHVKLRILTHAIPDFRTWYDGVLEARLDAIRKAERRADESQAKKQRDEEEAKLRAANIKLLREQLKQHEEEQKEERRRAAKGGGTGMKTRASAE